MRKTFLDPEEAQSYVTQTITPHVALLALPPTGSGLTGGLGLPNFMSYYWSANRAKLTYCIAVFENKCGKPLDPYGDPF